MPTPMFESDYQKYHHFWGDRPSQIVSEHYHQFLSGSVLDLGAGDGRNAIFLAKQGFDVTAIDIAPTGIKHLLEEAKKLGLASRLAAQVGDITEYHTNQKFANVVCIFVLHFLKPEQIKPLIEKMADLTLPGGINIIDDFTPDGPLAKDHPNRFVKSEFLEQFYSRIGWKIETLSKRLVKTKQFESPGVPQYHQAVAIVARKPKN